MKFCSTNKKSGLVSFKEALFRGLADDGGLFMPTEIPKLSKDFFNNISSLSFQEISCTVARVFLGDEIPPQTLKQIIDDAINFDAPLVEIDENIKVLELFHGPTLAFKDFGARFMARTISYFREQSDHEVTILVATSGDTGSAVANGFFNIEGIKVVLLYPSQKVSHIQEQQLTTLGGNISALEIEGTFDDCQRMVKEAFADKEITSKITLSSANSINIARLLPQSFYYFSAYSQLKDRSKSLIFSVPSGNFGNLTAGLIAYEMGLPLERFIAATNINDVFPVFLKTGIFNAKASVQTISNAMDVGNPSNLARIIFLYGNPQRIAEKIFSCSFSDAETKNGIKDLYSKTAYIIDPHGAVGYLALREYIDQTHLKSYNGIVLETAHPAKFPEVVEETLYVKIEMPENLKACLEKEKITTKISNDFRELKDFLLG